MKYDVLSIGNITKDVFIHVSEPCFPKGTKQEIKEIYFSYGGGALNTCVAFSNLNLKSSLFGSVGSHGEEISSFLKKHKIPSSFLLKKGKTAYSAILTGDFDRVILMHGGAISSLSAKDFPTKLSSKWFYISSLHGNFSLLKKIFSYAKKNKIKIAWNPGISDLKKNLNPFLKQTEILFVNKREFKLLKGKPPINTVITDGKKGAQMPFLNLKVKAIKTKVKDATGAGDAFNSAFLGFYILGYSFSDCLKAGAINSSYTIRELGAYTSLKKFSILKLLKKHF